MASPSKRIEEASITALKTVLLRCPILEPHITSNDRTPSWDGAVFVYKNESLEKTYLHGSVPIQGKGTEDKIVSETASFSCEVADLRNYYRGGGCIIFLISVDLATSESRIYYAALHVYDLKQILDSAGQQKYKTIKLNKFPQNVAREMASIFVSFIENARKQSSFVGKKLPSLEQLQRNGVKIESFTFNTSGVSPDFESIASFITTHDFYLYVKPMGVDVDIPIDKVSNAIASRRVFGKVMVKEKEFYPSFTVIYENGIPSYHVGTGISIKGDLTDKITVNIKPTGTLSNFIQDASCFIAMLEERELTLNGWHIGFKDVGSIDLSQSKNSLLYYKDVKKMLDCLGVVEELQCDSISSKDETNLRNFVHAVLYNRRIGFGDVKDSIINGPFIIGNLSIWIWATRQDDGYYKLESFFEPHSIAIFDKEDVEHKNPVPASHYLLLNKEAFIHASNMDYEAVQNDVCAMNHHPFIDQEMTLLLLNALRGYDERVDKDDRILDLAESICKWFDAKEEDDDYPIYRLNLLQILKRRRTLNTLEKIEIGKFTDNKYSPSVRCGAFLLLEDSTEAQKCFDEMLPEDQDEFIMYPICHFGNLVQGGKTNGTDEV